MTEAFTRQQYTWQELTLNLDTAQELEQIEAAGDYVRVDEASDPKAHVFVRLGGPFGPRRKLRLGGSIDGAEFGRLHLDWPEQSREDGSVPWVKLIVARTYGAVRFQNPDPLELDITGLVKVAPHVIAESGRRADHRYTLELFPIITSPLSVSYAQGAEVGKIQVSPWSGQLSGLTAAFGGGWWALSDRTNPHALVRVDTDGEALREYDWSTLVQPFGLALDTKRWRLAVFDAYTDSIELWGVASQAFEASLGFTEFASVNAITYDPSRDAFVVSTGSGTAFEWCIVDAGTGAVVETITAAFGDNSWSAYYWTADAYIAQDQDGNGAFVHPTDGTALESFSGVPNDLWLCGYADAASEIAYATESPGTAGTIVQWAAHAFEYNAQGHATAGNCGAAQLIEQPGVNVQAGVTVATLEDGKTRLVGEVVRALLELHFRAAMPSDYLDHVYTVRFGRSGYVTTGGAETWAAAGIADNFNIVLPQEVELVIDNELTPGS